jgi:hypothetical protein
MTLPQSSPARDSRTETLIHSQRVGESIIQFTKELLDRSWCHDRSKTIEPERSFVDRWQPRFDNVPYGSPAWDQLRRDQMKEDGQRQHFDANRHHPEHFPNGIMGMTLVDVVEMLCDWRAASERPGLGNLPKSLAVNAARYGIPIELLQIMVNTAIEFNWW